MSFPDLPDTARPPVLNTDRQGQRCTAHSRRSGGGPCRAFACAGQLVCAAHGGRAPQAKAAAAARLAKQRARRTLLTLGEAGEITDPVKALRQVAGTLHGVLDLLAAKIDDPLVSDSHGTRQSPAFKAWAEVQRDLRACLTDLAKLGIDTRTVDDTEAWHATMARVLTALAGWPDARAAVVLALESA
jgi:hypothetical protein